MTIQPTETGQIKVWHIPQIPGKPFEVLVPDMATAVLVQNILADYDLFQFENFIKPDYANVSGIAIVEDGEWWDFYEEDLS